MAQIKVCVLTPSYPTKAEPYSAFFVRDQVVALTAKGCRVSVVAPRIFGRGSMASVVDSVPVYNFSFISRGRRLSEFRRIPILVMASYVASGAWRLLGVVRREGSNVIHAHWAVPSGFIAVLVGKYILRRPVVITAHGSDITVFPERSRAAHRLVQFVLKRADHIIAVSRTIEQAIADEFGIPREKVTMIRLGVDLKQFTAGDEKQARVKLGLPLDKKIVLFAGDLVAVKGLDYLLAALSEVAKRHPDVLLYVIGEGSQREDLQRQAEELRLGSRVEFRGFRPHDEIPLWMRAADVFVLPSLSEGAPVSLMEAVAVGLPVVATHVGSVPELVEEGVSGFLVKSGDSAALAEKISLLLSDRRLRLGLAKPLKGRLDGFDMERAVAQVKAVYERLVDVRKEERA